MWVLPHYEQESLTNALKCRMFAENLLTSLASSGQNELHRSRKLLCSYPEVVSNFLKKYAADQAIAEYDASILRYIQLANTALQNISST